MTGQCYVIVKIITQKCTFLIIQSVQSVTFHIQSVKYYKQQPVYYNWVAVIRNTVMLYCPPLSTHFLRDVRWGSDSRSHSLVYFFLHLLLFICFLSQMYVRNLYLSLLIFPDSVHPLCLYPSALSFTQKPAWTHTHKLTLFLMISSGPFFLSVELDSYGVAESDWWPLTKEDNSI